MSHENSPSPALFMETVNAYQKSAAIRAAIELNLFSAVSSSGATAGQLAEKCGASPRGVRILADNLTILGFLIKNADRYELTPDSAVFLDRQSPAYIGNAVEFLLSPELTGMYDHLASTIRRGTIAHSELGTLAPEHPVWIHFARSMGSMMTPAACGLADLITLPSDRETKVLDVSASHGKYGIAFAEKNPKTRVTGVDWAPVLEIARENARKAGVERRYSTLAGDAFEVGFGKDYDLILIPNFLHHFSKADCIRFLRKSREALLPGGRVAVVEFIPNEDRISPPEVATFSLVMLGSTPAGDAYTFAEFSEMLTEAGFRQPEHHRLPSVVSTVVAVC
jgi:2-polyprenyl-3-methyl-5-hydroxy-6-metoxy-1,4-benzoquinol methylase